MLHPRHSLPGRFVAGVGALFAILAIGLPAQGQDYPNRPIRMFVGYPAGGSVDGVARRIAPFLQKELGQSVVVENRAGAGGVVAAAAVAKSEPDGYTLIMQASPTQTISPFMIASMPFDPLKDYSAISGVVETSFALVITRNSPARTLAEFITLAKANPGKLTYATSGAGSSAHLATELFQKMSGTNLLHVPYKGVAPIMTDLLSGRVDISFVGAGTVAGQAKAGQVRVLGISTKARTPVLPEVPTIAEAGVPGFDISNWNGIEGPPGLSPAIVARLNTAVRNALADPALAKAYLDAGYRLIPSAPEEMAAKIRTEHALWGGVIKSLNLKPE